MKQEGGNGYQIPHMGKERLEREGRLPILLSCEAELVAHTLVLIGQQ
jgi:hypothetical protein